MSTLFIVQQCHVYRVPARTSTAGYRAAEWGDTAAPLWTGRLRVLEHAETCEIRLEDANSGELFASAPYDVTGKSVEAVLDSSRYFVIRVESDDHGTKRHAYIGVGVRSATHTSLSSAARVLTLPWLYRTGRGAYMRKAYLTDAASQSWREARDIQRMGHRRTCRPARAKTLHSQKARLCISRCQAVLSSVRMWISRVRRQGSCFRRRRRQVAVGTSRSYRTITMISCARHALPVPVSA